MEAGRWLLSDRTEQAVRGSGRVVADAALNAYARAIVCRLGARQRYFPAHRPAVERRFASVRTD